MPAAHANRPRITRPVNLDLKRRAAAGTKWCHNEADLAPTISTKPPGNIHRRITSAVMGGKHSVHSSVQSALHHAANYTAEHRARGVAQYQITRHALIKRSAARRVNSHQPIRSQSKPHSYFLCGRADQPQVTDPLATHLIRRVGLSNAHPLDKTHHR